MNRQDIQNQLIAKREDIKKKLEELNTLYQEIDELQAKEYANEVKLILKVAPSIKFLKGHIFAGDIGLDVNTEYALGYYETRQVVEEVVARAVNEKDNKEPIVMYSVHNFSVNILGRLIIDGKIPTSVVRVVAYDKNNPDGETLSYTKEGYLKEWKIGFFDQEV